LRSHKKILVLGGLVAFLGSACYGATIAGTVNGADGAPFQGAFVEAQNAKTKITVIVLSDSQGRYRIPDLSAGDYRVQIRAVGYRADPRSGVTLAADQNASFDFALQKSAVRWNEISKYQAAQLWPPAKGKESISEPHCFRQARPRRLEGPRRVHAGSHAFQHLLRPEFQRSERGRCSQLFE
jgi:hypothetical protein